MIVLSLVVVVVVVVAWYLHGAAPREVKFVGSRQPSSTLVDLDEFGSIQHLSCSDSCRFSKMNELSELAGGLENAHAVLHLEEMDI